MLMKIPFLLKLAMIMIYVISISIAHAQITSSSKETGNTLKYEMQANSTKKLDINIDSFSIFNVEANPKTVSLKNEDLFGKHLNLIPPAIEVYDYARFKFREELKNEVMFENSAIQNEFYLINNEKFIAFRYKQSIMKLYELDLTKIFPNNTNTGKISYFQSKINCECIMIISNDMITLINTTKRNFVNYQYSLNEIIINDIDFERDVFYIAAGNKGLIVLNFVDNVNPEMKMLNQLDFKLNSNQPIDIVSVSILPSKNIIFCFENNTRTTSAFSITKATEPFNIPINSDVNLLGLVEKFMLTKTYITFITSSSDFDSYNAWTFKVERPVNNDISFQEVLLQHRQTVQFDEKIQSINLQNNYTLVKTKGNIYYILKTLEFTLDSKLEFNMPKLKILELPRGKTELIGENLIHYENNSIDVYKIQNSILTFKADNTKLSSYEFTIIISESPCTGPGSNAFFCKKTFPILITIQSIQPIDTNSSLNTTQETISNSSSLKELIQQSPLSNVTDDTQTPNIDNSSSIKPIENTVSQGGNNNPTQIADKQTDYRGRTSYRPYKNRNKAEDNDEYLILFGIRFRILYLQVFGGVFSLISILFVICKFLLKEKKDNVEEEQKFDYELDEDGNFKKKGPKNFQNENKYFKEKSKKKEKNTEKSGFLDKNEEVDLEYQKTNNNSSLLKNSNRTKDLTTLKANESSQNNNNNEENNDIASNEAIYSSDGQTSENRDQDEEEANEIIDKKKSTINTKKTKVKNKASPKKIQKEVLKKADKTKKTLKQQPKKVYNSKGYEKQEDSEDELDQD